MPLLDPEFRSRVTITAAIITIIIIIIIIIIARRMKRDGRLGRVDNLYSVFVDQGRRERRLDRLIDGLAH